MIISINLFSLISPLINHPISLGRILLIQSIFSTLLIITLSKNSLYPLVIFITFTGGLIVIFIYIARIASNEKFKFSWKILSFITPLLFFTIVILNLDKTMLFQNNWMERSIFFLKNEELKSIVKFLSTNKINLSIILIIYILISLISITNVINSFEGPLKKTYEKIIT